MTLKKNFLCQIFARMIVALYFMALKLPNLNFLCIFIYLFIYFVCVCVCGRGGGGGG